MPMPHGKIPARTAVDDDPMSALKERLRSCLSAGDFDEIERLLDAIVAGDDTSDPKDPLDYRAQGAVYAMDSQSPTRQVSDMLRAIEECAPVAGRDVVLACDGAEAVFRTTLRGMGVHVERGVHASALPIIFRAHRRAQSSARASSPAASLRPYKLASDTGFEKRFPDVAAVRIV